MHEVTTIEVKLVQDRRGNPSYFYIMVDESFKHTVNASAMLVCEHWK